MSVILSSPPKKKLAEPSTQDFCPRVVPSAPLKGMVAVLPFAYLTITSSPFLSMSVISGLVLLKNLIASSTSASFP